MKAGTPDQTWQRGQRQAFTPAVILYIISHCRQQKTRLIRGDPDRVTAVTTVVSAVPRENHSSATGGADGNRLLFRVGLLID
ncbi:MAG: hypothetical protein DMG57_17530 [Acidobacteria bacterium]|nr:MAG: hypothetical protein DMG57_17530 [Acidobacteriota bacterium]